MPGPNLAAFVSQQSSASTPSNRCCPLNALQCAMAQRRVRRCHLCTPKGVSRAHPCRTDPTTRVPICPWHQPNRAAGLTWPSSLQKRLFPPSSSLRIQAVPPCLLSPPLLGLSRPMLASHEQSTAHLSPRTAPIRLPSRSAVPTSSWRRNPARATGAPNLLLPPGNAPFLPSSAQSCHDSCPLHCSVRAATGTFPSLGHACKRSRGEKKREGRSREKIRKKENKRKRERKIRGGTQQWGQVSWLLSVGPLGLKTLQKSRSLCSSGEAQEIDFRIKVYTISFTQNFWLKPTSLASSPPSPLSSEPHNQGIFSWKYFFPI